MIDAHQHFWDLQRNRHPWLQDEPPIPFRYGEYSAIRRTYLPDDYRRDVATANVAATVHVEAEWTAAAPVGEQRWLCGLRQATGLPTVSVAQARLDRADVAEILAAQASFDFVRGIRHKPRAAADPRDARRGESGSMDDACWRAGFALLALHGLSFDLQTPFWHAEAAAALARDFPSTQIVVNHAFLPCDRSAEGLASWRRALELVADQPNVALKISGLGLPGASWPVDDNAAAIRDAICIFGVDRCMFASNYPVDSLCARFATILAGFRVAIGDRSQAEQMSLLGGNAARIYRIVLP